MTSWLLLLVAASSLSEHPIGERAVMGLVLRAPELTPELRGQIAEELRTAIEGSTLFRIEDLTDLVVVADDPVRALVDAMAARSTSVPELVLMITILPGASSGGVILARQLLLAQRAAKGAPTWVGGSAVEGDSSSAVVASGLDEIEARELATVAETRLLPELKRELEARGLWRPQGRLHLDFQGQGFELLLDDRVLATDVSGPITIDHTAAGQRRVTLRHRDYRPVEATVLVEADHTAELRPDLFNLNVEAAAVPRRVVAISGVGLMTAGAVFVTMALVRASDSAAGCVALADSGGCAPTEDQFARVGGVPVAPLGYSLFAAGAIMGVSVWATEPETHPWWYALLGVGVGALAFGVSVWAE